MHSNRSKKRRFRAVSLLFIASLIVTGLIWVRSALPEVHSGQAPEQTAAGSGMSSWMPSILSDSSSLYLPDFSYAGYRWGEVALPEPEPTLDALDFGVIPDDGLDDTAGLLRALEAAMGTTGWAVLDLPGGQLELGGVLFLERDSLILRGQTASDGSPATFLHVSGSLTSWADPKADTLLSDIAAYQRENNLNNLFRPYSRYTWAGGMLWSRPAGPVDPIPAIPPRNLPAGQGWLLISGSQGNHRIVVQRNGERPRPGQLVEIHWANRTGQRSDFLDHVLGAHDLPVGRRLSEDPSRALVAQPVTILAVTDHEPGWELTTHEPLLHDIRAAWEVRLLPLRRLTHIGIENLTIRFEADQPPPHHLDKGYNGIYLTDTRDAWIRNVHVIDADTPVLTNRTNQITISRLRTSGRQGHHSVYPSNSYGVLIQDFQLEAPALHHPTFPTGSILSVYTDGVVRHARLDQHGGLNQQNLYDALVVHADDEWLFGGGAGYWNPTAGRFNTFWNVQVLGGQERAGVVRHAPDARLVGIRTDTDRLTFRYGPAAHVEGLQRPGLAVPSLYDWQRERRLRPPDSERQP